MRTSACSLLGVLLMLSACSASEPSGAVAGATATLPSTPTLTTAPGASPTTTTLLSPTPGPSQTPDRPSTWDWPVRVVLVDGLNLRAAPGTGAPVQTVGPGAPTTGQPIQVSAETLVWIIGDEPVDSGVWYHVVVDISYRIGWVSGGPDDDPWLAPLDPTNCPGYLPPGVEWYDEPGHQPPLHAAMAEGRMLHSMRYPFCFGGEPLSAVVYWPTPEEAGTDVPCPWEQERWLVCYEGVNKSADGSSVLTVYGDPQDRPDVRRGEWVTITGHYNDSRAEDCRSDLTDETQRLADILFCRAAFVLDSVGPPPVIN